VVEWEEGRAFSDVRAWVCPVERHRKWEGGLHKQGTGKEVLTMGALCKERENQQKTLEGSSVYPHEHFRWQDQRHQRHCRRCQHQHHCRRRCHRFQRGKKQREGMREFECFYLREQIQEVEGVEDMTDKSDVRMGESRTW
jgi:hypothetical protein